MPLSGRSDEQLIYVALREKRDAAKATVEKVKGMYSEADFDVPQLDRLVNEWRKKV